MAKYPEATISKESASKNGDHLLEVEFLAPKSGPNPVRKVDPKFGKKRFRVTAGALGLLQEANDRINDSLKSMFRRVGGGEPDRKKVSPMDAGMAVFLYTRRIEPRFLPDEEIILDEVTVRGLLKKQFKGHF
ncbi:MAG: hypothetical protein ACLP07_06845 [Terracidiphilus sp.]